MPKSLSRVPDETKWDAQQTAKRLKVKEATVVTMAIHYFAGITSQSHDKSITDLTKMRQAEAKVEMLKAEKRGK